MNNRLRLLFLIPIFFINTLFASEIINYKSHYQVNEPVWFELRNTPNNPDDWIGIYEEGTNTDWGNVIAWRWVTQNSQTQVDPGVWYKFPDNTIPNKENELSLPEGNYIARFFLNNTYTVEDSVTFAVGGVAPVSSLTTYKEQYDANENIWLELKNAPGNAQDWIGIYPEQSSLDWSNVVVWRWAYETSQTSVDPGDWYKFPDTSLLNKGHERPLPAGRYIARFFLNNTYDIENSVPFSVKGPIYPPETAFNPVNEVPQQRPLEKKSTYLDTAFDNEVTRTVTRVTNREADQLGGNNHPYPKHGSAWNSDMTLLRIDRRIYDAETLQEIPLSQGKNGSTVDALMKSPQSGSSGIRWSKKDPKVLYVMSGDNGFYRLTLSSDRSSITYHQVYHFGSTATFGAFRIGHDEGNIDYNDRFVVLSTTKNNKIFAILLDIQNEQQVWKKELSYAPNVFDWISISPSGDYILVTANDKVDLYSTQSLQIVQSNLANQAGHGDIGIDENGDEIYVQLERSGAGIFGYILKNQARIQLLDSNHGGGHVSCRNYKLSGWCYISTNEKNFRDIFSVRLDGSKKVRRYAQAHQRGSESPGARVGNKYYYAENAFVNVSPDGSRVLFWSDFGNPKNYLYYDADTQQTTAHYYNRDTYQVTISQ